MSEYKFAPLKTLIEVPDSPSVNTGIPTTLIGVAHDFVLCTPTPYVPPKKPDDIMFGKEVAKTFGISLATLDRRIAESKEAEERGEEPTFPIPTLEVHDECQQRVWKREVIREFEKIEKNKFTETPYGVEDLVEIFNVSYQTILRWVKEARSGAGWLPEPMDTVGSRSKLKWDRKTIDEFGGTKGKRKRHPASNSNSETDSKTDEEVK